MTQPTLRQKLGIAGLALAGLTVAFLGRPQVQAVAGPAEVTRPVTSGASRTDFDFYVLALSWSPTHCAQGQAGPDSREQCQAGRPFAFVVHGLWPQYERGYPRQCATRQPGPNRALVQSMLEVMPSRRLVDIQWTRHGTCSGLTAETYFETIKRAAAQIVIPQPYRHLNQWQTISARELEAQFIAANPGMTARGIAVQRRDNLMSEVRICLTKDLKPRECPEVDGAGVGSSVRVSLPPQRGG